MNNLRRFESREQLRAALAALISEQLQNAITARGSGRLIVSGGNTPIPLFGLLAQSELAWDKVAVTLADERLVAADHPRNNAAMVKRELLQHKAAAASLLTLEQAATNWTDRPFADITLLGMGDDGHTASLFPDAPELDAALAGDAAVLTMTPPSQPEQRETFSLPTLCASQTLVLHIEGDSKLAVLEDAMQASTNLLPIRKVVDAAGSRLTVFWAP